MSDRRLSLIAGSGALVPQVIAAARAAGHEVQILSLGDRKDLGSESVGIDLAQPQAAIVAIRTFGATHIVMAGGLQLSDAAREGLAKFAGATGGTMGDSALSGLATALTQLTGAKLVGVHEIAPDLLAPEGHIGGPEATPAQGEAALHGIRLARDAGGLDLGQAVVVSGRRAIAVEDIAGTDALLMRIGQYRALGLAGDGLSNLVLAKASKPGQPLFVDLPAIGPDTVANGAKAGIAVIAVEAGRTLLIDRTRLKEAADAAGIAVIGIALKKDA